VHEVFERQPSAFVTDALAFSAQDQQRFEVGKTMKGEP
jgi:hypothetical protein